MWLRLNVQLPPSSFRFDANIIRADDHTHTNKLNGINTFVFIGRYISSYSLPIVSVTQIHSHCLYYMYLPLAGSVPL